MKRTNKIVIIMLLVAVMLLGIGYAAIQNITLNINGTASADPTQSNFSVKFSGTPTVSDISKVNAEITDDVNATIQIEGLTSKGDIETAEYVVQNVSEDLSTNLIVETSNSNEEYFAIDATLAKTSLVAGESTTLLITVELIKTPIEEEVISTIGINLTAEPVQPGEEDGGDSSDGTSNISTGLKGMINVDEGLYISLDAEHWVDTINFDDFDQTDMTQWKEKESSKSIYISDNATFQTPVTGIKNIVPTELLPISTTGYSETSDGIGQTEVKFYKGTNTEKIKLMDDIDAVTERGYFAFDLFLMNTSVGSQKNVLQLNPLSDVIGEKEATEVKNTVRVGFALYENSGTAMAISGDNNLTPAQIVAGTSTGKTIKDFAIWEPNANKHTNTIVKSLANSLKLDITEHAKWNGLGAIDSNTGISKFSSNQSLPTYALTSGSKANPVGDGTSVHISDIYDWRVTDSIATAAKGVKKQFTLQTNAYESGSEKVLRDSSIDLVSTKKLELDSKALDKTFEIAANQYQKIRVYFWMEGQDPDCIDTASLVNGLTLNIGFSKK